MIFKQGSYEEYPTFSNYEKNGKLTNAYIEDSKEKH
jgi:hypothetical protein